MDNNKSNRNRWLGGKGYYMALALCVAAVGLSGYIYYRSSRPITPSGSNSPSTVGTSPQAAAKDHTIPVLGTEPLILVTEEPTNPTEPPAKSLQTAAPVAGEVITPYAMEALSYNETTRDWRTHNGVDFAGEAGTVVTAAADGTISQVYKDDHLGWTVVIKHNQGYVTCYSGLSEEIPVTVGQQISMGNAIATIGEPSLVETAQGPHLHFEVTQNGAYVDPSEFLEH